MTTPSHELGIGRVSVEAFRAFRDRQEFNVGASAVILDGPNGTGKTSFFDAIQWVLIGSIERLHAGTARRQVEHVVNQYRSGENAIVELDLSAHGRTVQLRRTGDSRSSSLELLEDGRSLLGEAAERELQDLLAPSEGIDLATALMTSGLLQQDVMRQVLEAAPADQYNHISSVLGLSALEDFEAAVKAAAKEAKDRAEAAQEQVRVARDALERAKSNVETAVARRTEGPMFGEVVSSLRSLLSHPPDRIRLDIPSDLLSPEVHGRVAGVVVAATELLESIGRRANSLLDRITEVGLEPTPQQLTSAAAAVDSAIHRRNALEIAVRRASEALASATSLSQQIAQLASVAIPMLSSVCPVCTQQIVREDVEQHLLQRAAETTELLALRRAEAEARADYESESDALADLVKGQKELTSRSRVWAEIRAGIVELQGQSSRLANEPMVAISLPSDLAELLPAVDSSIEYMGALRDRLILVEEVLGQGDLSSAAERSRSEMVSLGEELARRTARLEELRDRAALMKSLSDNTVEARVEVTKERFRRVQPLVSDIYSRLDPHPAFKAIEFELDTFYRRGRTSPLVKDLVEGISADPLIVLSTSQANIAALSYFLAMGLAAGDRSLPFVLLDDPLQSMDDVNVLGFADLCRHLRGRRQLMLSTHERRFASLLRRKLAPRLGEGETIVLRFLGWGRPGPEVEMETVAADRPDTPIRLVGTGS